MRRAASIGTGTIERVPRARRSSRALAGLRSGAAGEHGGPRRHGIAYFTTPSPASAASRDAVEIGKQSTALIDSRLGEAAERPRAPRRCTRSSTRRMHATIRGRRRRENKNSVGHSAIGAAGVAFVHDSMTAARCGVLGGVGSRHRRGQAMQPSMRPIRSRHAQRPANAGLFSRCLIAWRLTQGCPRTSAASPRPATSSRPPPSNPQRLRNDGTSAPSASLPFAFHTTVVCGNSSLRA